LDRLFPSQCSLFYFGMLKNPLIISIHWGLVDESLSFAMYPLFREYTLSCLQKHSAFSFVLYSGFHKCFKCAYGILAMLINDQNPDCFNARDRNFFFLNLARVFDIFPKTCKPRYIWLPFPHPVRPLSLVPQEPSKSHSQPGTHS